MIRIKNPTPPKIPVEYQELDYIQSTGTQYIDTGYKSGSTYSRVVIDFTPLTESASVCYFGASNTSNTTTNTIAMYRYYSSGNTVIMGGISTKQITKTLSYDTDYIADIVASSGVVTANINGATSSISGTGSLYTSYNMFIFANNKAGTVSQNAKMKLRAFKIYEANDVLARDLIPCYRKSDNEAGMYDLVTNAFYPNAGSGTFLMGNEVGKRDININPIIVDKPLLRRYVGDKLVYGEAPAKEVVFTESIAPTDWTSEIAFNELGEWTASSSGYYSKNYPYNAFDEDNLLTSTYWCSTELSSNSAEAYIQLDCPVLIKPSSISITANALSNGQIQGYNPLTESWEILNAEAFSIGSSKTEKTFTLNTNTYYSKFRMSCNRYSGFQTKVSVYDFKIVAGTYKI